jgi:hypothetical protein
MTDTQTEQTAVDATNTTAQPVVAEPNAQTSGATDDLDALLRQYETETAAPTAAPQSKPEQAGTDDLKVIAEEFRAMRTERQQEVFNRDMSATVAKVRGDLDPEIFGDTLVKAYINARADEDSRLAKAWVERNANPKAFNRVVEQLGREFRQKLSKLPDRQATEDREAVTAAVRGASTRAPESQAPNYSKMSDHELQAEKDKLFGG